MSLEEENALSKAQPEQITASAFQRYLTLLAIKLLKRFRNREGPVLFLSRKVCVKYGRGVNLNDASTM